MLFNTDIVNFAWKTDEARSSFGNFCSLAVLESLVDEGRWAEAVSLILDQLKSYLFPADLSHI